MTREHVAENCRGKFEVCNPGKSHETFPGRWRRTGIDPCRRREREAIYRNSKETCGMIAQ